MASFKLAAEMGVEAVECDIHLTADGHLVVMHDETVDRTTNGTGAVESLTLAEIQALDAGSHFDAKFAGEKVPTLEALLNWGKEVGMPVVIEIKPTLKAEPLIAKLIEMVDRLGAEERIAVISFDHYVPLAIKKRLPHWMTGAIYAGRVVDPVGLARSAQVNGLLPHFAYVLPDMIKAMHEEKMWVGVWGPNSEAELRHAVAMGADMIGTNYPDRLRKLLGI
jgi:glycerophosphoryl diester phosphodiesterase